MYDATKISDLQQRTVLGRGCLLRVEADAKDGRL